MAAAAALQPARITDVVSTAGFASWLLGPRPCNGEAHHGADIRAGPPAASPGHG